MQDLINKTIADKYLVLEEIGRGGMAVVYKALHTTLQREVALKVLYPHFAAMESFVKRFEREAKTVARLSHPHIMAVHDFLVEDDFVILVCELVEGGSLTQKMHGIPLNIGYVRDVTRQLALAIDYAHEYGVVHRDIKPSNVLFRADGSAVLSDFGIATVVDPATQFTMEGSVVGTPSYLSPEQVKGSTVGSSSDQFSLAVLVYEMLCGDKPFENKNLVNLMLSIAQEPHVPIVERNPLVSQSMSDAVDKAMSKDPSHRFQTSIQFIDIAFVDYTSAMDDCIDQMVLGSIERVSNSKEQLTTNSEPVTHSSGFPLSKILSTVKRFFSPLRLDTVDHKDLTGGSKSNVFIDEGPDLLADDQGSFTQAHGDNQKFEAGESCKRDYVTSQTIILENIPHQQSEWDEDDRGYIQSVPYDSTQIISPENGQVQSGVADYFLLVSKSEDRSQIGQRIQISDNGITIGRSSDSDLVFESGFISRNHCSISKIGGYFILRDFASSNGVYVNGKKTRSKALLFGDKIQIGETIEIIFDAVLSDATDLSGNLVDERYKLEKQIYTSSKEAIYRARDNRLETQQVVIKILSPKFSAYPGHADIFKQDAQLSADLSHPNICKVTDYGITELAWDGKELSKVCYFCMPYLAGGSLDDKLSEDQQIPLEKSLRWLTEIAEALDYAHAKETFHGGIKPKAILLDEMENPYLSEFATTHIANASDDQIIVGSPTYMAPEQWNNEPLTKESDQFSLAVVAYRLFTGSRPFLGQENPEVRERNFKRGPIEAHVEAKNNYSVNLPVRLSKILNKALSYNPEKRFSSVQEFVSQIDGALNGASKGNNPRVFISYQRERSAGWANLFARELKSKYSIESFIDTENKDNAVVFSKKLRSAILNCDVFVCFLAEDTLQSRWVVEEIRLAAEWKKPIVPVFQECFSTKTLADPDECIERMLDYDAIYLLDRRNIYIDKSIEELALKISGTFSGNNSTKNYELEELN